MKTNYLSGRNLSLYMLIGLVGLLASSCGSYQNSSYYDNDGVYGSSQRPNYQTQNRYSEENIAQGNKYKDYFAANKDNYSNGNEVFTDVENYNSQSNDTLTKNQQGNYAGWGDNNKNVTVNYYNNSPYYGSYGWGYPYSYYGWGYPYSYYGNYGWGWNSYYGNYWNIGFGWGWNSPYYGWGWNSWYSPYYYGYYYPYNGYYGNHHYINGTRGGYSYYGNRNGSSYSNNGIYSGIRGNSGINNTPRPRSNNFDNPRTPTFNNPRNPSFSNPRNNDNNPRNNYQYQNQTPRPRIDPGNEPKPRSSEYSAPRNNGGYSEPRGNGGGYSSPRNSGGYSEPRGNSGGYSSPRSSGGSFGGGSFGGGGGSFGGGGGRSGGGGGRR